MQLGLHHHHPGEVWGVWSGVVGCGMRWSGVEVGWSGERVVVRVGRGRGMERVWCGEGVAWRGCSVER